MRPKLSWLVFLSAVIAVLPAKYAEKAWATSASGFTSETLALGRFDEIEVLSQFMPPQLTADLQKSTVWLSLQKNKGSSDVYVQSNTWEPGGSTGWHSHPGQSLIMVTHGTITDYMGDDSDCTPHVYRQGMGFVDAGGNHVHILRNESSSDTAGTIAIQLVP